MKQLAIEYQSTSQVTTSGDGSVLIQKSEVGEGRVRGGAKVARGEEGGKILELEGAKGGVHVLRLSRLKGVTRR